MTANDPGQPPPVSAAVSDWTRNMATPTSALAIGAHPDDAGKHGRPLALCTRGAPR